MLEVIIKEECDYIGVDNSFKCIKCNEYFANEFELKAHTRLQTTHQPYGCSICGQTFSSVSDLQFHFDTHENKPFFCTVCSAKFSNILQLDKHLGCHRNTANRSTVGLDLNNLKQDEDTENDYHTQNYFGLWTSLVQNEHLNDDEEWQTEHFPSANYEDGVQESRKKAIKPKSRYKSWKVYRVATHIKKNSISISSFECCFCPRGFFLLKDLKHHMRSQHIFGVKLKECKVCKMTFQSGDELSKHTRTHPSDEGIMLCHICAKGFSKRNSLLRHMQTHRSDKPFQCESCPYKGISKGELTKHIKRVHLKDRPYACTYCPYRSSGNSGLTGIVL